MEKIHIFIPVYYREPTVRKAVASILKTYKSEGYETKLIFVDNGSGESMQQFLRGIRAGCPDAHAILLPHNVGKAKAINDASKQFPEFDWFINCDSDIITFTPGWPGVLADCFKQIHMAGMLSVSYIDNGNNPMPAQPQKMAVVVRGQKYRFRYGGQVAGGCFLTSAEVWKDVGYRNGGVYGGVDGLFRQNVADSLMRKCGYIEEVKAEHLDDRKQNDGYHKWKLSVQDRIRKFSPLASPQVLGNEKGFWDK